MNSPSSNFYIVTTYLVGKPDPQRNAHVLPDQDSYLKRWVSSGLENTNEDTLCVIYNHLSDQFMASYENPRVRFFKGQGFRKSNYSANDYRFFCYKELLRESPFIESVFFTDCHDVMIKNSPNAYGKKGVLYIGKENRLIGKNLCMINQFMSTYGHVYYPEKTLLNCGIIGGERALVERFIDRVCEEMERVNPIPEKYVGAMQCADMSIVNKIAYDEFSDVLNSEIGSLHSLYKGFQLDRKDVCLIHK